ncbi:MAG TPA: enoyl-CoA hydratase/isomerase family protein [Fimbriiglobus sp.]|nr:enoyl-CoA hydratase/isomerase family protein [Fimbriiglobus sp.]
MLHESPHVRVEAADGVATLWLEFPGSPVNALTPARLADITRGLSAAMASPHIEVLVIRSGRPAGFCGGHDPNLTDEPDPTAFAVAGQRALGRLAAADVVTVAFVEGPCLGPGLELALACDYRLAVAGPDSWVGFPDAARGMPPCWGGATWLRRLLGRRAYAILTGRVLTAREARGVGLFDDAFCARRAKVELRTFLDRLQHQPRKRRESWLRWLRPTVAEGLAAERAAFREALRSPPAPKPVGADDPIARAVEVALRGTAVMVAAGSDNAVSRALAEAVRRGRVTPLEAEQARGRIRVVVESDRTAPRTARIAA